MADPSIPNDISGFLTFSQSRLPKSRADAYYTPNKKYWCPEQDLKKAQKHLGDCTWIRAFLCMEEAQTSQAGCRVCGKKIERGSARIAYPVGDPRGEYGIISAWLHTHCCHDKVSQVYTQYLERMMNGDLRREEAAEINSATDIDASELKAVEPAPKKRKKKAAPPPPPSEPNEASNLDTYYSWRASMSPEEIQFYIFLLRYCVGFKSFHRMRRIEIFTDLRTKPTEQDGPNNLDEFVKRVLKARHPPPPEMIHPLLPFQEEGLAWMVNQEKGPVKGGVLADEMGMGKTIQMIALICANRVRGSEHPDSPSPSAPGQRPRGGTLVVVPLAAALQWQSEIERFTKPNSLNVMIYHGANRKLLLEEMLKADVVLTTYATIESDYRRIVQKHRLTCQYCGRKFLPSKLKLHLMYMCGPDAVKTEKQAKQKRTRQTATQKAMKSMNIGNEDFVPTIANTYREIMIKAGRFEEAEDLSAAPWLSFRSARKRRRGDSSPEGDVEETPRTDPKVFQQEPTHESEPPDYWSPFFTSSGCVLPRSQAAVNASQGSTPFAQMMNDFLLNFLTTMRESLSATSGSNLPSAENIKTLLVMDEEDDGARSNLEVPAERVSSLKDGTNGSHGDTGDDVREPENLDDRMSDGFSAADFEPPPEKIEEDAFSETKRSDPEAKAEKGSSPRIEPFETPKRRRMEDSDDQDVISGRRLSNITPPRKLDLADVKTKPLLDSATPIQVKANGSRRSSATPAPGSASDDPPKTSKKRRPMISVLPPGDPCDHLGPSDLQYVYATALKDLARRYGIDPKGLLKADLIAKLQDKMFGIKKPVVKVVKKAASKSKPSPTKTSPAKGKSVSRPSPSITSDSSLIKSDEGSLYEGSSSSDDESAITDEDSSESSYALSDDDKSEEYVTDDDRPMKKKGKLAKGSSVGKGGKAGARSPAVKSSPKSSSATKGKRARTSDLPPDPPSGDPSSDDDEEEVEDLAEEDIDLQSSPLHSIEWQRIVLDEAHRIKSRTTSTAKGVFALPCEGYRWCLTGTPLQNRVGELYSLLRFLRFEPYAYYFCNKKECQCMILNYSFKDNRWCRNCQHTKLQHYSYFQKKIAKPIVAYGYQGEGKVALMALKNEVLDEIVLRRTKTERAADVKLPPLVVLIRKAALSVEEMDFYEALYKQSKLQFNTYAESGTLLHNFAHIFDLLSRLRQAVDHPYLIIHGSLSAAGGDAAAQIPTQSRGDADICVVCNEDIEGYLEQVTSACGHSFHRLCAEEYIQSAPDEAEVGCPQCYSRLSVNLMSPAPSRTTTEIDSEASSSVKTSSTLALYKKTKGIMSRIKASEFQSSTKIDVLLEELTMAFDEDPNVKAIVFSQFTSMLQLVEFSLKREGINCVQLTGSQSMEARHNILTAYHADPSLHVILISLKAGGEGLNLQIANKIFLMDPWWNPAAEMQAIQRAHRIGQTKPVRAVRIIAKDTIEERILQLQEKKQLVFDGTVGSSSAAFQKLSSDDLRFLFH